MALPCAELAVEPVAEAADPLQPLVWRADRRVRGNGTSPGGVLWLALPALRAEEMCCRRVPVCAHQPV